MRLRRLTGLALTALASGAAVVIGPHPAAADATTLYVDNTSSTCTDAGPGSSAQAFCTIAAGIAAVQPGETLQITGTYAESVTMTKSGAPGAPITIVGGYLKTANTGLTIDGQHDVIVRSTRISSTAGGPAVILRNSSALTLADLTTGEGGTAPQPVIALSAVTGSQLTNVYAHGPLPSEGIALDAATSGVAIVGGNVLGGTTAIDISGSHDTVSGTTVTGGTTAGIVVEPGASDTTIANAHVDNGRGVGISNDGATGTAIANNEVRNDCGTGIRVDGASSGVSVQNNVVTGNGAATATCTPAADAVDIGVYDAAAGQTVVDYNVVHEDAGPSDYAWSGTAMTPAQFRSASGQGVHDVDSTAITAVIDSANSAAPGYPVVDSRGQARVDDPNLPDTGAGTVGYADRGPLEVGSGPLPGLRILVQNQLDLEVDVSPSTDTYGSLTSLTLDFGDGTSASPTGWLNLTFWHGYTKPGPRTLTVTATDANGLTASATTTVYLSTDRPVALLAVANDRFVTSPGGTAALIADSPIVDPWANVSVIDQGNGYVLLQCLNAAQYFVSVDPGRGNQLFYAPYTLSQNPPDAVQFQLVTNADGSVSLKAKANDRYVTAESGGSQPLVANRTAIGPWEEFHLADSLMIQRGLLAHADNKYVTAESAGAKPLIANRTAIGTWEQFTLVDAGNGYVALYSRADNKFVTAEAAGSQPLIANRTAIGPWEKFTLISNTDGSISLRALANGKIVTAEAGGSRSLIANRTAVGPWEEFDLRW